MSDFNSLLRDISLQQFKRIYLLTGEEGHYIDELEKAFEKYALSEEEAAFDKTIVYGKDSSLDQVLAAAKAFPMMAERQLIMVKEAQEWLEWRSEEKLQKLLSYAENPQETTVLVISFRHKKPDGRSSVIKKIKKLVEFQEFKSIPAYKMADWIMKYVEGKGKKISSRAANIVSEYLGSDLAKVANELDKLFVVVRADEISASDIEENIGISKDYNVFELVNALDNKDVLKANQIVEYFAADPKNNPLQMILPFLSNHYSRLLLYHSIPDKSNLPSKFISPYQAKNMRNAAQFYPKNKVERIIGYIRDCDRKVKGIDRGALTDRYLMKEMVFKILH